MARKERYSEQLQPIPKNFIKEVSAYLKDKKEIANKKENIPEAKLLGPSPTLMRTVCRYSHAIFARIMGTLARPRRTGRLATSPAKCGYRIAYQTLERKRHELEPTQPGQQPIE